MLHYITVNPMTLQEATSFFAVFDVGIVDTFLPLIIERVKLKTDHWLEKSKVLMLEDQRT
jgi:hypothetical protein